MFSTGYVANVSTIAGLLNRHDYAVARQGRPQLAAHRRAACRARTMKRFGHNDLDQPRQDPRRAPRRAGQGRDRRRRLLDGRRHRAARRDASSCAGEHPNTFLLDDEAHGLGVLGERGRGAAEHHGVLDDVDLITITFSKTLGSCGGAVIGSADAIELLTLDADPFIFTASNTPGSIAAALDGAADPARRARACRRRSAANVRPLRRLLTDRGVPVEPGRERDHHDPAAPARRGLGGRARPRAARSRRVREPGGRAGRASGASG